MKQYELHWKDYYKILMLPKGCGDEEKIKSNYRNLMKMAHADANTGYEHEEDQAKDLNEAYDCLKDAERRAVYWRYYQQHEAGPQQQQRSQPPPNDVDDEAFRRAADDYFRRQAEEAARRAAQEAERQRREAEERARREEERRETRNFNLHVFPPSKLFARGIILYK
jgi:DnaJ-class molecular chaperone